MINNFDKIKCYYLNIYLRKEFQYSSPNIEVGLFIKDDSIMEILCPFIDKQYKCNLKENNDFCFLKR